MKNKKIKLFALSALLLLAGGAYIANYNNLQDETRVVEAAEGITISDSSKVEGTGFWIYINEYKDYTDLTVDNFTFEFISFSSKTYSTDPSKWVWNGMEYNNNTGRYYLYHNGPGYPNGSDVEYVVHFSCLYNDVNYAYEIKFVGNAFESCTSLDNDSEDSDVTTAAINYQYDNDAEPTAIRFIGTINNVAFENIESVDFVLALNGVERTIAVETLYTSIAGLEGFEQAENKYYAVYILKGLDATDENGDYKYRGLPFTADIKVTLTDETVVTAKEAKSFDLAPVIVAEQLSTIVGAVVHKTEGGYICAFAANTKASGYHIQVFDSNGEMVAEQDIGNGDLIDTKGLDVGTYTVKVKAVGDGVNYTDSEYVVAGTFEVESFVAANQLSKPVGVVRNPLGDGRYICAFENVANASSYYIQVYDSNGAVVGEQAITNGGIITCTEGLEAGTYTLKVKAVGDGVNYTDSEYSDPVTFTIE